MIYRPPVGGQAAARQRAREEARQRAIERAAEDVAYAANSRRGTPSAATFADQGRSGSASSLHHSPNARRSPSQRDLRGGSPAKASPERPRGSSSQSPAFGGRQSSKRAELRNLPREEAVEPGTASPPSEWRSSADELGASHSSWHPAGSVPAAGLPAHERAAPLESRGQPAISSLVASLGPLPGEGLQPSDLDLGGTSMAAGGAGPPISLSTAWRSAFAAASLGSPEAAPEAAESSLGASSLAGSCSVPSAVPGSSVAVADAGEPPGKFESLPLEEISARLKALQAHAKKPLGLSTSSLSPYEGGQRDVPLLTATKLGEELVARSRLLEARPKKDRDNTTHLEASLVAAQVEVNELRQQLFASGREADDLKEVVSQLRRDKEVLEAERDEARACTEQAEAIALAIQAAAQETGGSTGGSSHEIEQLRDALNLERRSSNIRLEEMRDRLEAAEAVAQELLSRQLAAARASCSLGLPPSLATLAGHPSGEAPKMEEAGRPRQEAALLQHLPPLKPMDAATPAAPTTSVATGKARRPSVSPMRSSSPPGRLTSSPPRLTAIVKLPMRPVHMESRSMSPAGRMLPVVTRAASVPPELHRPTGCSATVLVRPPAGASCVVPVGRSTVVTPVKPASLAAPVTPGMPAMTPGGSNCLTPAGPVASGGWIVQGPQPFFPAGFAPGESETRGRSRPVVPAAMASPDQQHCAAPGTGMLLLSPDPGTRSTLPPRGGSFVPAGTWQPQAAATQEPTAVAPWRLVQTMSCSVLPGRGATPIRGRGFGTPQLLPRACTTVQGSPVMARASEPVARMVTPGHGTPAAQTRL